MEKHVHSKHPRTLSIPWPVMGLVIERDPYPLQTIDIGRDLGDTSASFNDVDFYVGFWRYSQVTDRRNPLSRFLLQRIDAISTHGMWHTTWTGYGWTSPEVVVKGPKVTDVIGGKGFDPNSARAVIVNGNVSLVTWSTDGSSGTNGAWFSTKGLMYLNCRPCFCRSHHHHPRPNRFQQMFHQLLRRSA